MKKDIAEQKKKRKGFHKKLKRKFGYEAWNQVLTFDDVVVIPFVRLEGDIIDFSGMLYASARDKGVKYKMLSRYDILKQKNKGSLINLHNLGLINLFESVMLNEIDCEVVEALIDEIKLQFGEDLARNSNARDEIVSCYQVYAYYQDCITFGSTTLCGEVYSEPVYYYCNSHEIDIGGGSSSDSDPDPEETRDIDPCWDMDCFVEPCWRRVLGENRSGAKSIDQFCDQYSGLRLKDLQDRNISWWGKFTSQENINDRGYRYVVDPRNSYYVLDMRHLMYVGAYLGVKVGSLIEYGQEVLNNPSGNNWQDFYSNAMGHEFTKYFKSRYGRISPGDMKINALCDFLKDRSYQYLRPVGGQC